MAGLIFFFFFFFDILLATLPILFIHQIITEQINEPVVDSVLVRSNDDLLVKDGFKWQ